MSQHVKPCRECPWTRCAAKGWLGSEMKPEDWVREAHLETLVDCHMHEETHCAGLAIYRANVGKRLRAEDAFRLPADRELVFASPKEFIDHHRSGNVVSSEMKL